MAKDVVLPVIKLQQITSELPFVRYIVGSQDFKIR